ncbi:phage holin family protein [Leifsonia sp. YIM 134122]|uniref:Phage holin family protein n=1 Tax=Leifsonia stereocauli TaxID=3134136 RepID=A0ABU9VZC9_9MICO
MTDIPTPSEEKAASTSLGDLLSEVTRDVSTLMRQEVALAKAELSQTAKAAGKGAGLLGGAAVTGHFALLFLTIAGWWALGYLIGNAWSGLVVAVIYGIIAAVLYSKGRKALAAAEGAPQTIETVKEIPETLKRNEENR